MIDRIPKCLQTCLNCSHAVIYEEYSDTSRDIVFGGCWKVEGIRRPIDRVNCQRFNESPERVKRSFWKKWEGHTYIAYKENPFRYEQKEKINYDTFRTADNLLPAEQVLSAEEHENVFEKNEPILRDPKIIFAEHEGSSEEHKDPAESAETTPRRRKSLQDDEPIAAKHEETAESEQIIEQHEEIKGREQTDRKSVTRVTETEVPGSPVHERTVAPIYIHELPDYSKASEKLDTSKSDPIIKIPKTRSLILQALASNISNLSEIADFADVDPSTAHYHLRNLIREGRVQKISRGIYSFSDDHSLKNVSQFFENFLKNGSQSYREVGEGFALNPIEKSILMEILTKENNYERFSGRRLARKCSISRNTLRKYTLKLEKKKLIKIERVGKQYVYTPTKVAVYGLTAFFNSLKIGSKIDSSSSKSEPINEPIKNSKGEPITEKNNDPQSEPELLENVIAETSNIYNPSQNSLDTFDDYIAWQQKNAHRLIIQFKLLRCDHSRLKRTGWIFGQKSIHRHFTEAYIFKSKDPAGQIINVLPKEPFIFTSPFEFEDKITEFVNEIINRLREYGIVIDLSEPAEIKLEHVALENDVFARKAIRKGLLYFKSKTVTVDSTGEYIEYVIGIDKSKKIHLEVEGTEAHHFTEEYEAFIDDVVTKKINRRELKELPRKMEVLKAQITEEFTHIQDRLNSSIQGIENTQHILHENQLRFSQNLVSHVEMVSKIAEAADSVNKAADTIREAAESLKESLQIFKVGIESLAIHRMV